MASRMPVAAFLSAGLLVGGAAAHAQELTIGLGSEPSSTDPHYHALTPNNQLARHIFEHGTDGRFYSQVRKYHREDGKVYWAMAATPEEATLINRCDEHQTYESRLAAGTLPGARRPAR